MKIRHYHFIALIIIFFAPACNENKYAPIEQSSAKNIVKIDTSIVTRNISELCDSVSYIRLETPDACQIGKINKIRFADNRFIILGSLNGTNTVYVFGSTGKFGYKMNKLDSSERGNSSIMDFDVNEENNKLYVYYDDAQVIGEYDINSPSIITTYKAPPYFTQFSVLSDKLLFFRDGIADFKDKYGNARICQFDLKGNLQKKWMDNPLNKWVNGGDIYVSKHADNIMIARFGIDTIYDYSDSKLEASYTFISDHSHLTYNKFNTTKDKKKFRNLITNPAAEYLTHRIFDTNKYLYFYFKKGQGINLDVYNKQTKVNSLIGGLNNDINNLVITLPDDITDTHLLSVIYPHFIKEQYLLTSSVADFNINYKDLIKLNGEVTYDDNPIICLAHLKE